MKSFTDSPKALLEQQRQQLEQTLQRSSEATPKRPSFWRQVGSAVVNWLVPSQSYRIRQVRRGQFELWQVYDPISQRTHYFHSEAEVRAWLD